MSREQVIQIGDDTPIPQRVNIVVLDRTTILHEPIVCWTLIITRYPDLDQLFALYDNLPYTIQCDIPNSVIDGQGKRMENFRFVGNVHLKNFANIYSISSKTECEIILENSMCRYVSCDEVIRKIHIGDFPHRIEIMAAGVNEIIGTRKVGLTLSDNINHQHYLEVDKLQLNLYKECICNIGPDAIGKSHLTIYVADEKRDVDLSWLNLSKVTTLIIDNGHVKLGNMPKLISWTSTYLTRFPMPYCPKLRFINIRPEYLNQPKELILEYGELYREGISNPGLKFNIVNGKKKTLFDHTQIPDLGLQVKSARKI